ncbi:MAG: ATP-binding protein, partial [Promethearchaeota archaeon]
TGTGKSNFMQNFLINITKQFKKPFFLVEFKGEYHFLQENIKDLIVLWPGENFSINLFDPLGANPNIHAERIFDIIRSGQFLGDSAEYSPQMERVLIDILTKVCENKDFRSWEGFQECCRVYLKEERDKIPMLKQTLISLNNRIRRFSIGPMKAVFDSNSELTVSQLFNKKVILDLSSIIRLGGEKEDALFFLNMVLKYLWDRNLTRGAINYDGINHITIIEDAQYFAPQGLTKKSKLTSYLEDIALLQRGTGECLITIATRPNISKDILANNGVVLTFKNHIEKDIMCELLNLESDKKNYLSIMDEGQCIIRVNSIKEPFLLRIPYIKRNPLTVSEICKKNEAILDKHQKNSNIMTLDTPKSNNPVIHKNSRIKDFMFKTILQINSFRNRLKNDKGVCSKEIDGLNQSLNNDLVDVVKDDHNCDFDIYIKKLYMDQEKHK